MKNNVFLLSLAIVISLSFSAFAQTPVVEVQTGTDDVQPAAVTRHIMAPSTACGKWADGSAMHADGPYLIYGDNLDVRKISIDTLGHLRDGVMHDPRVGTAFNVFSDDAKYEFQIKLHPIARPAWKCEAAGKILVLSDPHSNFKCFVSLLQGNGVIDKYLNWTYGKNQLVIIGDVFDRGTDATQIFWLIYQLEQEAADAGGQLHFLYGNHEPMVLSGDIRYTNRKYKKLADSLGMEFRQLMGPDTELGRWLATRNTMMVIGDNLFVHAGISQEFLDKNCTIPQVNEMVSRGLFMTKEERKADGELYFMFKSNGPIWYRGLVYSKKKYNPASEETVDAALARYGVKRIFVGHTIFKNVRTFYRKKVIAVNVSNRENMLKGRSRGILIAGGNYYTVGDHGVMDKLISNK